MNVDAFSLPRVLPLFDNRGAWVYRPDLLVMACMAYPDVQLEERAPTLYAMMNVTTNSAPELNPVERDLSRQQLMRRIRERTFTAMVVLEACRLSLVPGVKASIKAATRLAARSHHAAHRVSSPETLTRSFERSFSRFRSTAHLQAAALSLGPNVTMMEADEKGFVSFLSRARAYERFLDGLLRRDGTKWNPLRVPPQVPVGDMPSMIPLTAAEIEMAART